MKEPSEKDQMSLDEMQEHVRLETRKGAHKITFFIAISFIVLSFLNGASWEVWEVWEVVVVFIAVLFSCYLSFHWWLSTGIAQSLSKARMRKKKRALTTSENPEDIFHRVNTKSSRLTHLFLLSLTVLLAILDPIEITQIFNFTDTLDSKLGLYLIATYVLLTTFIRKLVFNFFDAAEREKSTKYSKYADKQQKNEQRRKKAEQKRETEKRELEKEKKKRAKEEKERVKRIRYNTWGMLSKFGNLSSIKVCYWCGAEENYLDFLSGEVARKEWKHMNENGTPDKRYKENPVTIIFDSEFCCSNCEAVNEYRHWCDSEPYEKGNVGWGGLLKAGKTPFNETKFLRDKETKKVLEVADGASDIKFLNSNKVKHKR